jgi:putative DNA methylase
VKDLAYYLYDLAGNKRRDASEATAYNSLIALWSDLTGLATTVHDDADRQASLF